MVVMGRAAPGKGGGKESDIGVKLPSLRRLYEWQDTGREKGEFPSQVGLVVRCLEWTGKAYSRAANMAGIRKVITEMKAADDGVRPNSLTC